MDGHRCRVCRTLDLLHRAVRVAIRRQCRFWSPDVKGRETVDQSSSCTLYEGRVEACSMSTGSSHAQSDLWTLSAAWRSCGQSSLSPIFSHSLEGTEVQTGPKPKSLRKPSASSLRSIVHALKGSKVVDLTANVDPVCRVFVALSGPSCVPQFTCGSLLNVLSLYTNGFGFAHAGSEHMRKAFYH